MSQLLYKLTLASGVVLKRAYNQDDSDMAPAKPEWVTNEKYTERRNKPDEITADVNEGHEDEAYALLGLLKPVPASYDLVGVKVHRDARVAYVDTDGSLAMGTVLNAENGIVQIATHGAVAAENVVVI